MNTNQEVKMSTESMIIHGSTLHELNDQIRIMRSGGWRTTSGTFDGIDPSRKFCIVISNTPGVDFVEVAT